MKIDEVPQDPGMITDNLREVCYAVNGDGRYVIPEAAALGVFSLACISGSWLWERRRR